MNRTFSIIVVFTLFAVIGANAQIQTYCSNFSGNIACSSYDHGASSSSYCTSMGDSLSCTTYESGANRARVRRDYEAGQVVGTALGELILAAINEYKSNTRARQAKQDEWNQFVEDSIATAELKCEADPEHGTPVAICRSGAFMIDEFIHRHRKDFVPDGRNIKLLGVALQKTAPADDSLWTQQTFEVAFQSIDKRQLDKKIFVGSDAGARQVW